MNGVGSDIENFHFVDGAVGIIEHIIDGARERKDILTVERRDEGLVQFIDQDAAGFIGFFFLCGQQLGRLRVMIIQYALNASRPSRVRAGLVVDHT